jgi:hypothetical protein
VPRFSPQGSILPHTPGSSDLAPNVLIGFSQVVNRKETVVDPVPLRCDPTEKARLVVPLKPAFEGLPSFGVPDESVVQHHVRSRDVGGKSSEQCSIRVSP